MSFSPASILFDSSGNEVGVVLVGGVYHLQTESQVKSAAKGTSVAAGITSNPIDANTEALHVDGSNVTQPISAASLPLPTGAATEATLSTRATSAAQTDGSQRTQVVDGANILDVNASGQAAVQDPPNLDVALSTRATASAQTDGSQKTQVRSGSKGTSVAADITSNPIDANTEALHVDGSNVTQPISAVSLPLPTGAATEATLASIKDTDGVKKITDPLPAGTNEIGAVAQGTKAAGADAWPVVLYDAAGNAVDTRLDSDSNRRLYTTLRNETVSVSIGAVPADASSIVAARLRDSGSSADLLVDGSVTSVDFTYGPSTGKVDLSELRFFMSADNINFDGSSFGPISTLTNGLDIVVTIDGTPTTLGTLLQNEDFGLIGSPGTVFYQNTGPNDSLAVGVVLLGVLLDSATSDTIHVTVQDDLTNMKFKFFQAEISGVTT